MAGAVRRFARLLGQGLSLAVGRRPSASLELVGFGSFVLAWLLATLVFALHDLWITPPPREFWEWSPWLHAGFGAAWLAVAWVAVRVLQRPAAWFTLACLAALVAIPWTALDVHLQEHLEGGSPLPGHALIAARTALVLVGLRLVAVVGRDATLLRRMGAGAVLVLALLMPWVTRAQSLVWYSTAGLEGASAVADGPDPEVVLGRQPTLVAQSLAALAPQTPGAIDLYAVGFAGDGNEAVFRNEVEYFAQLLPRRFGATDRVLPLINHPGTVETVPVASLANLRSTLAGIGARIDPAEDLVLLFLNSHGSREHVLSVDLPPLPLRQIEAGDVRAALDDAGIRWRVVIVSACFSGGFIEALRTPETLVITAARADRTSFGCGGDAEITYFGRAFLADGLNRTTDLREAYAIAAREVREWERAEGHTPSQPQIWAGDRIDAHLARWRAGLAPPGAPLEFVPAVPADDEAAPQ